MSIPFHGAILHRANFFRVKTQHIEALETYFCRLFKTVTGYASVVCRALDPLVSQSLPIPRVGNRRWIFVQ